MAKAKTSITTENHSGSAADAAAKEQRTEMPLSDLHPFEGHPFKVLDDELMEQTVESIKQIGVVSPLIVRPDPEGGYEILSGHRRLHAAQLAGLETVPVIVKEMDDDAAIIFMVDSNLQRENILPSERAFSYKMKLEAMKHQGQRGDLTSDQVGQKSWAVNQLADDANESKTQVQRFIRLTNLIPEILDMVDEKKIAFNPAVELSYLKPSEQKKFLEAMDYAQASPSLSQAQRLKKLSQEGGCTLDAMCEVMNEIKKDELDHVTIKNEVLRKYFPKSYTPKQMQDTIIRLLEKWQRSKQRDGRMVEIYLMVSLAPIPFATFGNHEQSHTGQNYLRSLFALGFQGFLIMICVGIYAVLIQNLSFSDNIISSIWGVMGYTVLLAFTLFKTGSLAKSVFAAH